jgi:hypothetical protein
VRDAPAQCLDGGRRARNIHQALVLDLERTSKQVKTERGNEVQPGYLKKKNKQAQSVDEKGRNAFAAIR